MSMRRKYEGFNAQAEGVMMQEALARVLSINASLVTPATPEPLPSGEEGDAADAGGRRDGDAGALTLNQGLGNPKPKTLTLNPKPSALIPKPSYNSLGL